MARQTRAQRRARREQQAASEAQAAPRGRTRQMAVRAAPEPAVAGPPSRSQQTGRVGGVRRFIGESWGELQKVEWPTQNQLIQGVVVVIVACLVVGIFLWGADLVFKRLVENVLLR